MRPAQELGSQKAALSLTLGLALATVTTITAPVLPLRECAYHKPRQALGPSLCPFSILAHRAACNFHVAVLSDQPAAD